MREIRRLGMRSRMGVLLVFVVLATCSMEAPLCLSAEDLGGSSWKSFELIYYDPGAKPDTLSPFNVDARSQFTTEMRIEYLRRYADALVQRTGRSNPEYFAFDVVTANTARKAAAQIKEKPLPEIRKVVPLKYWRWKLEPDLTAHVDSVGWVVKDFGGELLWNAMDAPRMFSYDRAVWLRTHFRGPQGQRVLLSIGSIIDMFEVWVNGRYVTRHSGFEPATLDITQFVDQGVDNTLAVRIENKPKDQVGIADEISVIGVSDLYLSDIFVKTDRAQGRGADATLEVEATQLAVAGRQMSVKVEVSPWFPEERREPVFSDVLPLPPSSQGAKKVRATLHLHNIDLWSPDAPHLYLVRVILQDSSGNACDDLVEVAGFRRIEQRQGRLFLNGRPWFLKSFGENLGFAPGFSFAGEVCPPDEWILRDFLLAKKANANAIRVHPWGFTGDVGNYTDMAWPVWGMPNSSTNYQRIAWIADQLGIGLVWGTRLWTLWPSDFQNKYGYGDDAWQARLKPSLRYVRNRPSILIYEGLNEVSLLRNPQIKEFGYLEQSYERFCQRYFELVNRIDDSRLVMPDTPWGPLGYSPPPNDSYTVVHPAPRVSPGLYTAVENTIWTDHNYFGWYRNLPDGPLLDKAQERPFVLDESGAEAMPDWRLYQGMPWNGIWLNNGRPSGRIEEERLGRSLRILQDSEVNISQANQGLSIVQTISAVRFSPADGINVNLIADGLAEGNYHKGVCDLYRNAKLGYFAAQMAYQPLVAMGKGFDFVLGSGEALHLQAAADALLWGKRAQLTLEVVDESGGVVDKEQKLFTLDADQRVTSLGDYVPRFPGKGFYLLRYTLAVP
jgi:hypothetical protein